MPQTAWSDKRERQYKDIKRRLQERDRSEAIAQRIAAATVNPTRTAKGETKEPKSSGERAQAGRDMSSAGKEGAETRKRRSR